MRETQRGRIGRMMVEARELQEKKERELEDEVERLRAANKKLARLRDAARTRARNLIKKKRNRLVLIGGIGLKKAYLNVSREEAINRFRAADPEDSDYQYVQEFEFNDEFGAYDAWSLD